MKLLPTLTVTDQGPYLNAGQNVALYHLEVNLEGVTFPPNSKFYFACDQGRLGEITPDGMQSVLNIELSVHQARSFRVEVDFTGPLVGETVPSDNAYSYSNLI